MYNFHLRSIKLFISFIVSIHHLNIAISWKHRLIIFLHRCNSLNASAFDFYLTHNMLCCPSYPSPLPSCREVFIYFWLQRQGHRNSYFIPVHCFQVTSLSAARARSGGCSDIWTATTMADSLFPSCTGWNTIKTSRVWNRSSTVATRTGKMTSGHPECYSIHVHLYLVV